MHVCCCTSVACLPRAAHLPPLTLVSSACLCALSPPASLNRYTAEALEQFDSQLGEVVVPDTGGTAAQLVLLLSTRQRVASVCALTQTARMHPLANAPSLSCLPRPADWETGPAREHLERDIAAHVQATRCVHCASALRLCTCMAALARLLHAAGCSLLIALLPSPAFLQGGARGRRDRRGPKIGRQGGHRGRHLPAGGAPRRPVAPPLPRAGQGLGQGLRPAGRGGGRYEM